MQEHHNKSLELLDKYLRETPKEQLEKEFANLSGYGSNGPTCEEVLETSLRDYKIYHNANMTDNTEKWQPIFGWNGFANRKYTYKEWTELKQYE